jgi:pimeloyl-ACP methyl ester carboxylesterase
LTLTARTEAWRRAGEDVAYRGYSIHVHRRSGEGLGDGPLILFLHGFPSSSYDWRRLLELGWNDPVLAFDFLGFGLSDKPRDHDYTLSWQADLAEELASRYGGGGPVFVCAHDMGTSVATELFARDLEGRLDIDLRGALLFNGSIVLERSSPTAAQRALRSRGGAAFARLTTWRLFRRQLGSVFSPRHPLTDEEAADQWSLVIHNQGRTLGHKLVAYMDERIKYAERWHGAIRDWPKPLHLAWGMLDPVATPAVLAALRELRPGVPTVELPDLGHYPQIEDPQQIAAALRGALAARDTGGG